MTDPQPLCGITHDYRGTEHPPCTRPAGHVEAYCHSTDGRLFLAHPDEPAAGTDAAALLADNQHLRQQLTEMTRCRDNALRALHRDDVETDIDLEETIAAPFYGPGWDWDEPDLKRIVSVAADAVRPAFGKLTQERDKARDRVAELEAYAYGCDAEGCVIPHSSWCEAAKKTAAANNGCTCPQPWKDSPQPHAGYCWLVSPPRAEVEEMRRALAEMRTETLTAEADLIVACCPDHGTRDGVWMTCHCPVADDMRRRAAARPAATTDSTPA